MTNVVHFPSGKPIEAKTKKSVDAGTPASKDTWRQQFLADIERNEQARAMELFPDSPLAAQVYLGMNVESMRQVFAGIALLLGHYSKQ